MQPSRRFALFRMLTLLEIVAAVGAVISMFASGSGLFAAVMVTTLMCVYAAGFAVALIGVVSQPRQPLILVSLALHVLIGFVLLLSPEIEEWINQREQEEFRRIRTQQSAE